LNVAPVLLVGFVVAVVSVVAGPVVSTVHVEDAGALVFPTASVPWTRNVCEPSTRPVYVFGLVQIANAAPSSEHWNVVASAELNVNVALELADGLLGELLIATVGGVLSTNQVNVAGVASTFPAPSFARTVKVCVPCARPVYAFGLVQAANASASSLHSNIAVESGDANTKVAVLALVPSGGVWVPLLTGPDEIVVSGAVVSIVHVKLAGEASTFAAASFARTWKVCDPSASPLYAFGEEQEVKAPVSSAHSNVAPVSGDENEKLALAEFVLALGLDVIEVSGALVSIVHVDVAGDASTFPTESVARTWKVWEPSASGPA
jgi:hypothetical protein